LCLVTVSYNRFVLEQLVVAQRIKTLTAFMKPLFSLTCSQETATGPQPWTRWV